MIEISLVPTKYVDTCWNKLTPFAEKAAKNSQGRFTSEDFYKMVSSGDYQLWIAYENEDMKAMVITNIVNYTQRRILSMSFCSGKEIKRWISEMITILKRFAKDMGCDSIEAHGRPGWANVLKKDGYQRKWVSFELPV